MDVVHHDLVSKKIKFFLVFFYGLFLLSCKERDARNIEVIYAGDKAVAVALVTKERFEKLSVYREGETQTAVLGDWEQKGVKHIFHPIIPFTNSQRYVIKADGQTLNSFNISSPQKVEKPELLAIFPSTDTVPQNLLKMYFVFSEPMQKTGRALDFVTVFDEVDQREVTVFLELKPELWSHNHDTLTLWLDPGRIKTGLIPNETMGLPLIQGRNYTLRVDNKWKSSQGISLKEQYAKHFYVTTPDSVKPSTHLWQLNTPKHETNIPLEISFNEPMDALLSVETMTIKTSENKTLKGTFKLSENERLLKFYPKDVWKKGVYDIHIAPVFEDLAGNNLNRLFDENLENLQNKEQVSKYYLEFEVD